MEYRNEFQRHSYLGNVEHVLNEPSSSTLLEGCKYTVPSIARPGDDSSAGCKNETDVL